MAVPSYPDFHVTGAVHHYIRVKDTNASIYYLGTCETTPKIQIRKFYRDIFNDIGGRSLPMQRTRDGQAAAVGCLMTRYSKAAYTYIESPGVAAQLDINPGQESRVSRGGLSFGRDTFELWQVFENAVVDPTGALGFRSAGLEFGLYWPQVQVQNHDRDTLGTEGEKLLVVFDCQPLWLPQAVATSVNGAENERGWWLYSKDDSDFPSDVLVPQ